MTSDPTSRSACHSTRADRPPEHSSTEPPLAGHAKAATARYICPMCPEVREPQQDPDRRLADRLARGEIRRCAQETGRRDAEQQPSRRLQQPEEPDHGTAQHQQRNNDFCDNNRYNKQYNQQQGHSNYGSDYIFTNMHKHEQ